MPKNAQAGVRSAVAHRYHSQRTIVRPGLGLRQRAPPATSVVPTVAVPVIVGAVSTWSGMPRSCDHAGLVSASAQAPASTPAASHRLILVTEEATPATVPVRRPSWSPGTRAATSRPLVQVEA